MKKILLLIILLIPITVNAESTIISHLIDAEIEIAGGLRIKELIIFDGKQEDFSRTINYKMLEEIWDKKNYNAAIYNGYSIENIKVAVLPAPKDIDFDQFTKEIENEIKELDPKTKSTNFYTNVKNKLGSTINIHYEGQEDKIAFYLDYVVSNVVVVHEDVLELNYTFKNIDLKSDNTLIRLVIPYGTTSPEYNYWVHGPSNGSLQELVTSNEDKVGFIATFPKLKSDINIRLTLPKEQVGIDIYLNKSNIEALDKIIELEESILKRNSKNENALVIIKYILIIICVLYLLGSFIIYKYPENSIFYLYIILGLILMIFNLVFKYHIIYIYFIILIPIIIKLSYLLKTKKRLK